MAELTPPGHESSATSGHAVRNSSPEVGDELPEDLIPAATRGKYSVPDNARRRRPATVFAIAGVGSAVLWFTRSDGGVLVNSGFLIAAISFLLLAAYFAASARGVHVWEDDAIETAKEVTGLPGSNGRAQLAWRGLIGRPVWRVLLHDETESGARRGVVIVDAAKGSVVEHLTEDVPAT